MKNILTFEQFLLEKRSAETFHPKRRKEIVFDPRKNFSKELEEEFFDLIQTAYAEIGGHSKIKSPSDVFKDPDWNWWSGIDIHHTEDFDIIMFGEKTKYGVKFAGVGHDGTREAKRKYIETRAKSLLKPGFFIEVSGKIADILIRDYGIPQVNDPNSIEKITGKKIEWLGNFPEDSSKPGSNWYSRLIGGHPHTKIMLGKPKI